MSKLGDYEAFSFVDHEVAKNALSEAREFVRTVSTYLRSKKS